MSNDQAVRLEAVLDWLEHGQITLEQAAAKVAAMSFPQKPKKTVWQRLYDDANGDPEMPEPGSFFDVSLAYSKGRITKQQYAALAKAAAEATRRDDR